MGLLSAAELGDVYVEEYDDIHGEFLERVADRVSGADAVFEMMRQGVAETEEKIAEVFSQIGMRTETMRFFLSQREVMRLPPEQGGNLQARPIIPGLGDDNLSRYEESDGGYELDVAYGRDPVIDSSSKKYKLNNIFLDATVVDKLQISARRLQSAKRIAVTDPIMAAAGLTDYIKAHGFPNMSVTAGDYAKTVNNSVAYIRALGRTITYPDSAAPAVVTHTDIAISYDQFHLNEVIWTVKGPLKYATEVNVIYQLAIRLGPEHVLMMAAYETIQLGINIYNEITGEYYTGSLQGYSDLSGIIPLDSSFPSELTADQQTRLLAASKKISPICVGDAVIGTAVHVSDKHVILNEHTLTAAVSAEVVPMLCGQPIDESMSVAGDVSVVKRTRAQVQWSFREPDVGERVVLCYSVGDNVEYSEILQVLGCADQLVLSDSNVLRKGASGAAVIALRDSALLGIFSTKLASRVFCARFTSTTFAIVSDCQSVTTASQCAVTPGGDAGDRTYAKMVKKGLMGFLGGIEKSVASLYTHVGGKKNFVGVVANVNGEWSTTVDPDESQLFMADARMMTFRRGEFGSYVALNPPPILQALPNVRAVEPGERVFVFTKVDDDVYMSSARVVTHCYVDNRGFVVEDFGECNVEQNASLIVAERDAAVVGMYQRRSCDVFGNFTVQCLSLRITDSGTVHASVRGAVACFADEVVPNDDLMHTHVSYGQHVWLAAVGRRVCKSGGTLDKATVVASDLWYETSRKLMNVLGWSGGHFVDHERYGWNGAVMACLAVVYSKESEWVTKELDALLDDAIITMTPVVGEFPFPRTGVVNGLVISRPRSGGSVDGEERIRDLENRMSKLIEIVGGRKDRNDPPDLVDYRVSE